VSVTWWSLVRFVHVLAAMVWVGGQLLLSTVVLPVLRARLAPAERGPLVRATALRFGRIAKHVLLPLLLASGLALAWHRGVDIGMLSADGYGRLLSIKLVLVVVAVALAAAHGIVASSRPSSARPLAILSLATSVSIVVFATALVP
jgi:uncharacterized membrane protein